MYYLLGRLGKSLLQEVSAFKIHIQILQTDLHTFLLRIVERIWFNIPVPLIMNLVILVTFTLDDLLMLLGENRCWSLLGPKGLKWEQKYKRFVREQLISLFKVARLYHFNWMNKQWLFQIRELVSHSHFLHCPYYILLQFTSDLLPRKNSFEFSLGIAVAPREMEDNTSKLWG